LVGFQCNREADRLLELRLGTVRLANFITQSSPHAIFPKLNITNKFYYD
jgi:hypothetical protein